MTAAISTQDAIQFGGFDLSGTLVWPNARVTEICIAETTKKNFQRRLHGQLNEIFQQHGQSITAPTPTCTCLIQGLASPGPLPTHRYESDLIIQGVL